MSKFEQNGRTANLFQLVHQMQTIINTHDFDEPTEEELAMKVSRFNQFRFWGPLYFQRFQATAVYDQTDYTNITELTLALNKLCDLDEAEPTEFLFFQGLCEPRSLSSLYQHGVEVPHSN